MIKNEQSLLQKNRLAAAFTDLTIEALKEFREQFISNMKTIIPTQNDPMCINMQRALGRIDAIDYVISKAEEANKPQN